MYSVIPVVGENIHVHFGFIKIFIQLFAKYFLCTYYVVSSVTWTGEVPACRKLIFYQGGEDRKKAWGFHVGC